MTTKSAPLNGSGLGVAVGDGEGLASGDGLRVTSGGGLVCGEGVGPDCKDAPAQLHSVLWPWKVNAPTSLNALSGPKHSRLWRAAKAHCLDASMVGWLVVRTNRARDVMRITPPSSRTYSNVPCPRIGYLGPFRLNTFCSYETSGRCRRLGIRCDHGFEFRKLDGNGQLGVDAGDDGLAFV